MYVFMFHGMFSCLQSYCSTPTSWWRLPFVALDCFRMSWKDIKGTGRMLIDFASGAPEHWRNLVKHQDWKIRNVQLTEQVKSFKSKIKLQFFYKCREASQILFLLEAGIPCHENKLKSNCWSNSAGFSSRLQHLLSLLPSLLWNSFCLNKLKSHLPPIFMSTWLHPLHPYVQQRLVEVFEGLHYVKMCMSIHVVVSLETTDILVTDLLV